MIQVTIRISPVLNRNLDVFCAMTGEKKSDAIAKAIGEHLVYHGFDPDREPKIQGQKLTRKGN